MVKAFTLIELIIGLIISSIVVITAGAAFNIVNKQFAGFKKTNEELKDHVTFEFLLRKDLERSAFVKQKEGEVLEAFYPERTILYKWYNDKIIRSEGNVIDTFRIRSEGFLLYYMGKVQERTDGLVDKVGFKMRYDDEIYECSFTKTYSAHDMMQEERKEEYERY